MQKTTDEIYKWINSVEGQKALQQSHDECEKYLQEKRGKEWNLKDWIDLMFTPYQQKTDRHTQLEAENKEQDIFLTEVIQEHCELQEAHND